MNKRTIILTFILGLIITPKTFSQNHGIGIHFGGYDFYGPQTNGNYFKSNVYQYSYNDVTRVYDTTKKKKLNWTPLVGITYWWNINKHIDLNMGLFFSNAVYPTQTKDSNYIKSVYYREAGKQTGKILTELDARVNYNLLDRNKFWIAPYLFAGITGSYHDLYFGADIPVGAGLNVNLSKHHDLFLNLESAYKIAATEHDQNHLQHSVGFIYWFKPHYKPEGLAPEVAKVVEKVNTPVVPKIVDTDGDGIEDSADECPNIAGLAAFNGCPDSDGDGISDKKDACPLVAGLAEFNGCPDTDGDGIPDNLDKCPYEKGVAARQGCPIPDADHDGFNDDVDHCPNVYSLTNNGCPEIKKETIAKVERAAKAIYFETGKSIIKKASYKNLDVIVAALKAESTINADIEGHTDNVGDADKNMTLSQARAEAVKAYFEGKGVEANRLTATGFGQTKPIADNKTAAGKAKNRRTEIKLKS